MGLGASFLTSVGLRRCRRPLGLPHLIDILVQHVGTLIIPRLQTRAGIDDSQVVHGIDGHALERLIVTGKPAAEDLRGHGPERLLGAGVLQHPRVDCITLDQDVEDRRRIDRGIDQSGILGGNDGFRHGEARLLQLLLDLLGNGRRRGFHDFLGLFLGGLLFLGRLALGLVFLRGVGLGGLLLRRGQGLSPS